MQAPAIPANERERMLALHRLKILDTPVDERFDRLTRLLQQMLGGEMALVSLVDSERQWFKSRIGVDVCETSREVSFCAHAIHSSEILEVEDATADSRFADNPLVQGPPGIRFYAGAPLTTVDGYRIGTLCIADTKPRRLTADERARLRDFADCVEDEINRQQERQIQEQLTQSQSRSRAILEAMPDLVFVMDSQGYFRQAQDRPDLLVPKEHLLGRCITEIMPEDVAAKTLAAITEAIATRRIVGFETPYTFSNGKTAWFEARACRLSDVDVMVIIRNISREKAGAELLVESRRQLERHNLALSLLNHIAFELPGTLGEQIERALELGRDFLQADLGVVSEVVGETYTIKWFVAPDEMALQQEQTFGLDITYCSLALQQEGELAIDHMGQSPYSTRSCYQAFGLESYIGIALDVGGQTYGTVCFNSIEPRLRLFDDTDCLFLRLLARWVSAGLERSISQDKLDKLVEQVPGMIFQFRRGIDGSVAFPYSSPNIRQIFGVDPEDVRKDASIIFSRIYAGDVAAASASIDNSALSLADWRAEFRTIQSESDVRWVEGRARAQSLPDGSVLWHGYITDIHERKQAELALLNSETRLRSLFELSPLGIALHDFNSGRLLDFNAALLEPTGYTREEFEQLSFWDITAGERAGSESDAFEELRVNESYGPYEKECTRKDGSCYPVRLQGILIKDTHGRAMVWSLVEDISERRKIERMKNEFVSTVSHELRTPLTSISGSLGLVAGGALGPLPPQMKEMIAIAQKNSHRLTYLINDLLDMEKLLSGNMRFNFHRLPLKPLLEQSIYSNLAYARQYQVTLVLGFVPPGLTVYVDAQRLEQVLANLLSNAVKFSPVGASVDIVIEQLAEQVEIAVIDKGPGIPAEFYPRIFQKFAQADASDSRAKGGTGLGLAITRELVERMGGTVGFDSKPGQVTRFFIKLPLSSASARQ